MAGQVEFLFGCLYYPPTPPIQFWRRKKMPARPVYLLRSQPFNTPPHPGYHHRRLHLRHRPSSRAVFLSWHRLHSACQFVWSQKSPGSPLWGMMWSTTVAAFRMPLSWHSVQSGFLCRNSFLAIRHFRPYPLDAAESRCRSNSRCSWIRCFSHRLSPASMSAAHPG